MAKKVREENKWEIPNDWTEETDGYLIYFVCVPNSRGWRGIFDGLISMLSYGRKWNRNSGSILGVQETAREVFESMCAVRCDELLSVLSCICDQLTQQTVLDEQLVKVINEAFNDGEISVGPDEQFPDQESYFVAKCRVANGIYDTVLNMSEWMEDNVSSVLGGVFGGITTGIAEAVSKATPAGWAWSVVSVFVSELAGLVLSETVDFEDIVDALHDTHEDCVLALYNSSNAVTARDAFISAASSGTPSLSGVEKAFVGKLLRSNLVNQLFAPRGDLAEYISDDPIDCGGAVFQVWSFETDDDGFTFVDLSDSGSSASTEYEAEEEALRTTLVVQSAPNVTAWGQYTSPTGSWAITPGASVQVDFGPTSDAPNNTNIILRANYSDATWEEDNLVSSTSGTLVLTLTQSKTITDIQVADQRSTSGSATGSTNTRDIQEVRIIGV